MKINYLSDFKLREVSEVEDTSTPFRFKYKTSGISSFVACYDGENYTNCTREQDGSLLVIFDDHNLPAGEMHVLREYYLTDADYADGICNRTTRQLLDITLTDGASDPNDPTVQVVPTYQKGDSFTFEDFTAEQLAALKGEAGYTPIKGVDYFTEEDMDTLAERFVEKSDLDFDAKFAYGIEFDTTISDPECTRIGNMDLHRSLPIQSAMRGCLLSDDGTVAEYLPAASWEGATLDGSQGQVMVEIPEYYCKFMSEGTRRQVWISPTEIDGYTHIPKCYVSAYEASLNRSSMTLCSVANTSATYRGGNNDASRDSNVTTLLGRPATNISLSNFRNYARKHNPDSAEWNCLTYQAYKSIYWLFVVEYATLESQASLIETLTDEGFKRGGLGGGPTGISSFDWMDFNDRQPFIPCGHTNSLGNGTGYRTYRVYVPEGLPLIMTIANRYRGIENPFGHLLKVADGILVDVRADNYEGEHAGESRVFIADECSAYATFSQLSNSGYDGYRYCGDEARENSSYIREVLFGTEGEIIASACGGGSSSTFFTDSHFTTLSSSFVRCVRFGGNAQAGSTAGLLSTTTSTTMNGSGSDVGTRLCYHPNN